MMQYDSFWACVLFIMLSKAFPPTIARATITIINNVNIDMALILLRICLEFHIPRYHSVVTYSTSNVFNNINLFLTKFVSIDRQYIHLEKVNHIGHKNALPPVPPPNHNATKSSFGDG